MAILRRSPHTLSYKIESGAEDENGDWVQGKERWIEDYCKCDVVPAGKANILTMPDGSTHSYSYTIYLPKECKDFECGDIIKINRFGGEQTFEVLGFQRYQLQCKIWV